MLLRQATLKINIFSDFQKIPKMKKEISVCRNRFLRLGTSVLLRRTVLKSNVFLFSFSFRITPKIKKDNFFLFFIPKSLLQVIN